jgi:hypothetical protein
MIRRLMALFALLYLGFLAEGLSAQACLGIPTRDGSIAMIGSFMLTDGAKGFGGTIHGNLDGPISLQAGYAITDIDDLGANVNSFHAGFAFEIPDLSFSACPFIGAVYSTWSDSALGLEADLTQLVVPIGLGIGKQFAAGPSLGFTIFATPQFFHVRSKVSIAGFDLASGTDSASEFGLELGFRLGTSAAFGGAGVSFTSVDESDPVFNVVLGFAAGRRR